MKIKYYLNESKYSESIRNDIEGKKMTSTKFLNFLYQLYTDYLIKNRSSVTGVRLYVSPRHEPEKITKTINLSLSEIMPFIEQHKKFKRSKYKNYVSYYINHVWEIEVVDK